MQRLALLLLALALVAGVAWWLTARQTIDFIGIVQPRVPAPQDISDWQIDLHMSHASVRILQQALEPARDRDELDVRILLTSHPTQAFKGKLHRDSIRLPSAQLAAGRATVRLHPVNDDIPLEDRVPDGLLSPNVSAHVRVDCR